MKKNYKVRYLPLFYDDLTRIVDYIVYKLGNEIAAKNLIDEIEKEIKQRANNPQFFEKYMSTRNRKNTYYRIYVKNYIIFYIVRDDVMEIRRMLYSKRNFNHFI